MLHLEPVVKFAAHLKNISCVNISEIALLHFRTLFKHFELAIDLNLATSMFEVVRTSWTNMVVQFELLVQHH